MNFREVANKDQLLKKITQELDKSPEFRLYTRLAFVRIALAGLPVEVLATLSGKSKSSINLWIRLFTESGTEALQLHQGKLPKLCTSQMEQIRYDFNHVPSDFGYSKKRLDRGAAQRAYFKDVQSVPPSQAVPEDVGGIQKKGVDA